MAKQKSFNNLLQDLHSETFPDAVLPTLASEEPEGVAELSPLLPEEAARLQACELVIREGLSTFLDVGNALLEIRHGKLFRSTHRSFEAYSRERFGLQRRRAYAIMETAEVVRGIAESGYEGLLPQREFHARALAEVPEADRATVWATVTADSQKTGKLPTARQIREATSQFKTPAPPADPQLPRWRKTIRQQLKKCDSDEVKLQINGSWLVRCGLEDAWRGLRGKPEWVINEKFTDWLTLDEARHLGILPS
jgi:hypothetical protein